MIKIRVWLDKPHYRPSVPTYEPNKCCMHQSSISGELTNHRHRHSKHFLSFCLSVFLRCTLSTPKQCHSPVWYPYLISHYRVIALTSRASDSQPLGVSDTPGQSSPEGALNLMCGALNTMHEAQTTWISRPGMLACIFLVDESRQSDTHAVKRQTAFEKRAKEGVRGRAYFLRVSLV